jgi:hypothetical protein
LKKIEKEISKSMSEKIKVKKSPEILKYRAQKCKNIRLQGIKRILYIWTEPDWNPSILKAIGRGGGSQVKKSNIELSIAKVSIKIFEL